MDKRYARPEDHGFSRRFYHAWKRSKYADLNVSELARALGYSIPAVQTYLNGLRYPEIQRLVNICHEFEVSMTWLALGKGPMKVYEQDELDEIVLRFSELSEPQAALIKWEMSLLHKDQINIEKLRELIIQAQS